MFNRRRSTRGAQYDISQYTAVSNSPAANSPNSNALAAATAIGKSFNNANNSSRTSSLINGNNRSSVVRTNSVTTTTIRPSTSRASSLAYQSQSPMTVTTTTTTTKIVNNKQPSRTQSLTSRPSTNQSLQKIQRKVSSPTFQQPGQPLRHRVSFTSSDSAPQTSQQQRTLKNQSSRLSLPSIPSQPKMIKKWVPSAHGLVCIEVPSGAPSTSNESNLSPITQRAFSRASSLNSLSIKSRQPTGSRAGSLTGSKPQIRPQSTQPVQKQQPNAAAQHSNTRSVKAKSSIQSMHAQGNTSMTMEPTIQEDEEVESKQVEDLNGNGLSETDLAKMKEEYLIEIENERLQEEQLKQEREKNERLEEEERSRAFSHENIEDDISKLNGNLDTSTIHEVEPVAKAIDEDQPITDLHIGNKSLSGDEIVYSEAEIQEAQRKLEELIQAKEKELIEQMRTLKQQEESTANGSSKKIESSLVSNASSDEEQEEDIKLPDLNTATEKSQAVTESIPNTLDDSFDSVDRSTDIEEEKKLSDILPSSNVEALVPTTSILSDSSSKYSNPIANKLSLNLPDHRNSKISVTSSKYSDTTNIYDQYVDAEPSLLPKQDDDDEEQAEKELSKTPEYAAGKADDESIVAEGEDVQPTITDDSLVTSDEAPSKTMAQRLRPTLGVTPPTSSSATFESLNPPAETKEIDDYSVLTPPKVILNNEELSASDLSKSINDFEVPQRSEKRTSQSSADFARTLGIQTLHGTSVVDASTPNRRKSVLKNSTSTQNLGYSSNESKSPAAGVYTSLATAENTRLNAMSSQTSLVSPDPFYQQKRQSSSNASPVRRPVSQQQSQQSPANIHQQQQHSQQLQQQPPQQVPRGGSMRQSLRNSQPPPKQTNGYHKQAQTQQQGQSESHMYASAAAQQSHFARINGTPPLAPPSQQQQHQFQSAPRQRPQSIAQFQSRQAQNQYNSHSHQYPKTHQSQQPHPQHQQHHQQQQQQQEQHSQSQQQHQEQPHQSKSKYVPSASTVDAKQRVAELYKRANSVNPTRAKADGSYYNNPFPQHLAGGLKKSSSFERLQDAAAAGSPGVANGANKPGMRMSMLTLRDEPQFSDLPANGHASQPINSQPAPSNGGPTSYSGGLFRSRFANDSDEDLPAMNYKPSLGTLRSASHQITTESSHVDIGVNGNGNVNGHNVKSTTAPPQRFFSEQVTSSKQSPKKSKDTSSGGDDKKKTKIGGRLKKLFGRGN